MTKIYLFSRGCKTLSDIMLVLNVCLDIFIALYGSFKNVILDLFLLIVIAFFSFGFFAAHFAKIIIIDSKTIVFYVFHFLKPKKYEFSFSEIICVQLDKEIYDINVISIITKKEIIKFTGYNSLCRINKNLAKSLSIVNSINEKIHNSTI